MARRLKRAAEIIPEINYRPGVIDPDVESALISLLKPTSKAVEQLPAHFPAPVNASESIDAKVHIETPTVLISETGTGGTFNTTPAGLTDIGPASVLQTPSAGVTDTPTVGIPELPTASDLKTPTGRGPVQPTIPVLDIPPVGVTKAAPVGVSLKQRTHEIPPGGVGELPPESASETPPLAESTPPDVLDIRHVKLRPVRNIQDGLTPGEFLLLTEMFKAAAPLMSSKDRMLQGAGYRTMSQRTGQDPKTVKRNRQGLTKKFCIEATGQNTFTEAAQFRVLHFDTILAGWRSAGLHWVRRAGRTVDLISGRSTVGIFETPPVGGLHKPAVFKTLPGTVNEFEAPTGETPPQTEGKMPTGCVGVLPAYLSSSSIHNKSSTAAPPIVAAAVIREFGFVDDDALQTLVRKCRYNAPDATAEEIAELATMTARRISKMRGVDNPVGLLIAQTANCFTGEPFAIYRREKAGRERRLAELYHDEN